MRNGLGDTVGVADGVSDGDGLDDVACLGAGLALALGESDRAPDDADLPGEADPPEEADLPGEADRPEEAGLPGEADLPGDADLLGESGLLGEAAGDPPICGEVAGSAAELVEEQAEMATQASKARIPPASLARNLVLAVGRTFMEPSPGVTIWPPVSDVGGHEANAHLWRIYANGGDQCYLVQSVASISQPRWHRH